MTIKNKANIKAKKVPTFEVFTKRGYLKPHLRRAFLEQVALSPANLLLTHITLRDGSDWLMQIEEEARTAIASVDGYTQCILSCQEDWHGNKIAVVRLFKEKEGQNGTNIPNKG